MTKPRLKWVAAPEPTSDFDAWFAARIRPMAFSGHCKAVQYLGRKLKKPPVYATCQIHERAGWTIYETESWMSPVKYVERFVVMVEEPGKRVIVFERVDPPFPPA